MISLSRLSADKNDGSGAQGALDYLRGVVSQCATEAEANKRDEYYLADQQQQRWISLGITDNAALVKDGSRIEEADFLHVAGGRDPRTTAAVVPQSNRRSPGTDITMSPSKGVSILWAAASQSERREIEAALHDSTRAALAYALRQGWFKTRRGSGRQGTQVLEPVAGIQAASFVHTTSRSGDPSLHQHTLIMGVARTADGHWRSLDFAEIFRNQKVISARFDAEIAHRLRERFGVQWESRGSNNLDIAGVSDALRDQFSKRQQEIDNSLDDHLHGTQRARDIASVTTRGKKIDLPAPAELEKRWTAELARHVPPDDILSITPNPSSLVHAVAARRVRDQAIRNTRPDLAAAQAGHIRSALKPQAQAIDQSALNSSMTALRSTLKQDERERLDETAAESIDNERPRDPAADRAALSRAAVLARAAMNDADRARLSVAAAEPETTPNRAATEEAGPDDINRDRLARAAAAKRIALSVDSAARVRLATATAEPEGRIDPEPEPNQRQAGAGERLARYFVEQGHAAEHRRWQSRMRPTTAEDLIVRDENRAQKQIDKKAFDLVGHLAGYDGIQQIYAESLYRGLRHDSVVDQRALMQQAYLIGASRGVAPSAIEDGLHPFLSSKGIIQGHANGEYKTIREGALCVSTHAVLSQENDIRQTVSAGVGVVEDISRFLAHQPGIDKLSSEQRAAAGQILGPDRVNALEAPAGAGKTTTSKAVLGAAEDAGYRSILVAPSHKAARVLAEDSGRPADSIQSLLASPQKLKEINAHSLILVDEAGMVSLDDMAKLMRVVDATGARVILQGDVNQLESPGGGSALHLVSEIVPPARIETIRRQSEQWQKDATAQMSKLRSDVGMKAYLDRGFVDFIDAPEGASSSDATIAAGVDKYLQMREAGSALALAYTRSEVNALNQGIRHKLAERGELGEIVGVEKARQKFSGGEDKIVELEIRAGDRLRVGERTDEAGVKTGDIITVLGKYDQDRYLVSLNKDGSTKTKIVAWNDLAKDNWAEDLSDERTETKRKPPSREKAAKIAAPRAEYFYASTIHGSQGDTVDRAVLVDSKGFLTGREAYVGGSRHRHELAVVVDRSNLEQELIAKQVASGTDREDVKQPTDEQIKAEWLEKLKRFGRNINVQDLDLVNAEGAAIGNPLRGEVQPREDHYVIARDEEIAGKRERHAGATKPKEHTNERRQDGHESRADGRAAGDGRGDGDDRRVAPDPGTDAGDRTPAAPDRRAEAGDRGPDRYDRRANGIVDGFAQAGHDPAGGRPAHGRDPANPRRSPADQRAAGAPQPDSVTHPAATRVPGRAAAADEATTTNAAVAKPSARDRSRARQRDRGRTPGGMSM
jgi:conjugative relaxase-like TrwC/TraI family protein